MMTDARGKLGGQVFSKSRSGAYIATKTIPRNTQSQLQLRRRADFAQFSNEWNNLTDSQQESWKEWATAHPLVNQFGDSYTITGRNYFMRNMAMLKLAIGDNYTPVETPFFLKKSTYILDYLSINNDLRRIDTTTKSGSRLGYWGVFFLSKFYRKKRSIDNVDFLYIFGDQSLWTPRERYENMQRVLGTPKIGDVVYYKVYIITPSGEFFAPQIGQCVII